MAHLVEHGGGDQGNPGAHEHAAVELPTAPPKSPAANFDRFLTTQVARLFFGEGVGLEGSRFGHYPFQTITSSSSSAPKARRTRSRTSAIRASMSAALAPPALMKKLAWRSLTRASPTWWPFRPSSSIIRPAEAPGGFLKMHPALF